MSFKTLKAAFLALALLISGCANSPSHRQEIAARPHLTPGYLSEQRHATISIRESWMLANDAVDVTLTMPSGDGLFPLIVYLPGLGESSEGGAAWRRPWAEAGYAVLAVQPETISRIWSSPAARNGEFRELAKEQFSPRALDHRQTILKRVLAEIKRRKNSSAAAGYSRIDLAHVAIAGFDVGAQTAMFVAGERIDGVEPFPLDETVKCVIALSPYADFSGLGFEQRFKTVHIPVLSVTSMDDTDQYGLVTSATIRRAPFEYMLPGRKYFLSLFGAPHTLLSGKETPAEVSDTRHSPATSGGDGAAKRGRGNNRRGGTPDSRSSSLSPALSIGAWDDQLRYVQSVTTAYLDALVKNDPIAQEWLTKDAKRWLGDGADLVAK